MCLTYLYYNCQFHSGMAGTFNIVDSIVLPAEIKFIGATKIEGTLTASMYSGSGRGLFDIPRSALSEEVFRIASGSVTASVAPDYGFKIESLDSGSQFTGSLQITGSIYMYATSVALRLESSSNFFGEGAY